MTNSSVNRLGRPDRLFCYGTLCIPAIMRQVSGTVPVSRPAVLPDYAAYALVGLHYPGIVPEPGTRVNGVLYGGLGRVQFMRLDAYEGEQYRRIRVWLDVGDGQRLQAWTYALQARYYRRRSDQPWSLAQFRREQLKLYITNSHHKFFGLHGRDSNQST